MSSIVFFSSLIASGPYLFRPEIPDGMPVAMAWRLPSGQSTIACNHECTTNSAETCHSKQSCLVVACLCQVDLAKHDDVTRPGGVSEVVLQLPLEVLAVDVLLQLPTGDEVEHMGRMLPLAWLGPGACVPADIDLQELEEGVEIENRIKLGNPLGAVPARLHVLDCIHEISRCLQNVF